VGWFASAVPLGARTIAAVAPGDGAGLNLVNPTTEDARVTITSGDDRQRVTVPAGATSTVDVQTSRQLVITGADRVVAGVTYAGDDGIAGFPLRPVTEVSSPVRVYP